MLITHRRICWPDPDALCLKGGCLSCAHGPWKRISTVKRYARRHRQLPDRYGGMADARVAFEYGLLHSFGHVPVRARISAPEKERADRADRGHGPWDR